MTRQECSDVQRLLDAAKKLILDYHTETRNVRYKSDEENIDALADALKPFEKNDSPPSHDVNKRLGQAYQP